MKNNMLEHSDFEVKQACDLETGDCIKIYLSPGKWAVVQGTIQQSETQTTLTFSIPSGMIIKSTPNKKIEIEWVGIQPILTCVISWSNESYQERVKWEYRFLTWNRYGKNK